MNVPEPFHSGRRPGLARSKRSTPWRSALTVNRSLPLPLNCRTNTCLHELTAGWSGSKVKRSLPVARSHTFSSVAHQSLPWYFPCLMLCRQEHHDAALLPSGLNTTDTTGPLWPRRVAVWRPVSASQSRTVSSRLAVATVRPLGAKATHSTMLSWPCSTSRCLQVRTSHSRTPPPSAAQARVRPSGENTTQHPACWPTLLNSWPPVSITARCLPVTTSQSTTRLGLLLASSLPLGEKANDHARRA